MISIKARAKVNLFLHINAKRTDGYHLMQSMIVFADNVYDELRIKPADQLSLVTAGPFSASLGDTKDNLVFKATQLLSALVGYELPCELSLGKNIPVASGIGGGSADAAAAIKLVSKLWNINLDPDVLRDLCVKLGADVFPCYNDCPAYFSGIGEIVARVTNMPKLYMVLVNPLATVSTGAIFKARSESGLRFTNPIDLPGNFSSHDELIEFLATQHNDLQLVTSRLLPAIEQMIVALTSNRNCLLARMSGSGATCFGLFRTLDEAQQAATYLQHQHPSWWVAATTCQHLQANSL